MLKITNPYTQETLAELPESSEMDLKEALEQSVAIVADGSKHLSAHQRIKILQNAKELLRIRFMEVVQTATLEGGKPITDTVVEVERAINGIQLTIDAVAQLKGDQVPMGLTPASEGRLGFTYREPIGVVAAISAFNHPVNLIVHQAVTAIGAGCPVIVKPSLKTPMSCQLIQEIFIQSGLPEAWFQILLCDDATAERLATSAQINFLSFIGSAKVGWALKNKLAPGVRCALEHGGLAPVLINEDIDLKEVVPSLAKGAFYHAGQVCVSVQRIYAKKGVASQLAGQLAEYARSMKVGDPLEKDTAIGPLIDNAQVERIHSWVQEAIDHGAQVLTGGKPLSHNTYAPTVLYSPSEESLISREEVFGPVVAVYPVEDMEEAVVRANQIPYHFQAAVFSNDINWILKKVKQLNAAAVMVNDHSAFRVDWMPFGGRSQSGYGVGGILQTMKDLTQEKLVVIKSEGNTF